MSNKIHPDDIEDNKLTKYAIKKCREKQLLLTDSNLFHEIFILSDSEIKDVLNQPAQDG